MIVYAVLSLTVIRMAAGRGRAPGRALPAADGPVHRLVRPARPRLDRLPGHRAVGPGGGGRGPGAAPGRHRLDGAAVGRPARADRRSARRPVRPPNGRPAAPVLPSWRRRPSHGPRARRGRGRGGPEYGPAGRRAARRAGARITSSSCPDSIRDPRRIGLARRSPAVDGGSPDGQLVALRAPVLSQNGSSPRGGGCGFGLRWRLAGRGAIQAPGEALDVGAVDGRRERSRHLWRAPGSVREGDARRDDPLGLELLDGGAVEAPGVKGDLAVGLLRIAAVTLADPAEVPVRAQPRA